jgi:hypothetical protein
VTIVQPNAFTDTLTRSPKATQLDELIPFEIPTDEAGDPTKVLFAVQNLAKQHESVRAFLEEHFETIEYLNRRRD